jgi:hypothetical protein
VTEGAQSQESGQSQQAAPELAGPKPQPLGEVTPEPTPPQTADGPPNAAVPMWRQRRLQLAAGAAALVLAAVLSVVLLAGGSKDLGITFTLQDFGGRSDCEGGSGGYDDIGPGTNVVVRNNDGQVIGTARLGDGESLSLAEELDEVLAGGCIWSTTVQGVPTGEDFYSVSVGDRGEQTYSEDDLDNEGWGLSLQIGGS